MAEPREFFEDLEMISVDYQNDHGHMVTKQTGKLVISNAGNWALILFLAEVRQKNGTYKPRAMLHRYRNIGGGWRKHNSMNVSESQLARAAVFTARARAES